MTLIALHAWIFWQAFCGMYMLIVSQVPVDLASVQGREWPALVY